MKNEISPEQQAQINEAQLSAEQLKANYKPLSDYHLDLIFREARSHNGWLNKKIDANVLHQLHDLTKMGATSMNICPARFVFVQSDAAKEKLKPALAEGNVAKALSAPVIAIIGYDEEFYEHGEKLFPPMDIKPIFEGQEELIYLSAFRNGTLQGAYFMLAARALGLDCGPMSGFDNAKADELFFAGTKIKSNFLCCLGYGDTTKLFQRLPRFDFDEACTVL